MVTYEKELFFEFVNCCFLVFAILLTGCREAVQIEKQVENAKPIVVNESEYPKTIVDSAGRMVTVNKVPERVVIPWPQPYEALRTLDISKSSIVGIAKDLPPIDYDFFPEVKRIRSVGEQWNPDIEEILSLNPDTVILHPISGFRGGKGLDELQDALEKAGVSVLRFGCNDLETYPEELKKLGEVFNQSKKAEEFLNWREDILKEIKNKLGGIKEDSKPNVYFMPAYNEGEYFIYGQYAYIDMTGGKDAFSDLPKVYVDRHRGNN